MTPPQITQERDPWSRVPHWLLTAVKPTAVVVYAQLAAYAWMRDGARPAIRKVAADLDVNPSTVERAIRELELAGAVVVEHRSEGGVRLPSRYHLRLTEPTRSSAAPPGTDAATPPAGMPPGVAAQMPVEEEAPKKKNQEGGGGGTRAAAAPSSARCARHLDLPSPPACGACAAARRALEQQQRDAEAAAVELRRERARAAATATREPASTAEGRAAARAALRKCPPSRVQ